MSRSMLLSTAPRRVIGAMIAHSQLRARGRHALSVEHAMDVRRVGAAHARRRSRAPEGGSGRSETWRKQQQEGWGKR
eukprot:7391483-Prymnesium_polylepis.1